MHEKKDPPAVRAADGSQSPATNQQRKEAGEEHSVTGESLRPDEFAALMRETGDALSGRELPPFVDEDEWTEDALARALVRSGRTWAQQFWRALMLAPSIEVCEALLRGEDVPLEKLDPYWVERFSLKGESNE